jgi:hypothetical protein
VGKASLYNNGAGNSNTAVGDSAGYNSTGSRNIYIGAAAGFNETGDDKFYVANGVNKTLLYGNISSGQILLGVPNPTGYAFRGAQTLHVLGGIIADSVRVALGNDWPDFVFRDDYPLRSLQQLRNYINLNKHLPDIPATEEINSHGINVAEMDARLLQKIEELHLYILQLQAQIELQETKAAYLQKQINELRKNSTRN